MNKCVPLLHFSRRSHDYRVKSTLRAHLYTDGVLHGGRGIQIDLSHFKNLKINLGCIEDHMLIRNVQMQFVRAGYLFYDHRTHGWDTHAGSRWCTGVLSFTRYSSNELHLCDRTAVVWSSLVNSCVPAILYSGSNKKEKHRSNRNTVLFFPQVV